jgi:RHS repeat-associated protein
MKTKEAQTMVERFMPPSRSRMSRYASRWLKILVTMAAFVSVAAQAAETVTYYYTSPQGTVLAKTDAAGNVISNTDYRPYGAQALGTPEDGPGYGGHVNDTDTGLLYVQARYYDAETGRFYSSDPVAVTAGDLFLFNRYSYANGNPVAYTDPTGMLTCNPSGEVSASVQRMRDASDGCSSGSENAVAAAGSAAIGRGLAGGALEGLGIAAMRASPILMALSLSGDTTVNKDEIFVYVTYVRFNAATGQAYAGRTRGFIRLSNPGPDLTRIVNLRAANQPILNGEGFSLPVADAYTQSYLAIRGREQQLIDYYGGAKNVGGSARNMINGIAPGNIRKALSAMSDDEFGHLPDNSPTGRP